MAHRRAGKTVAAVQRLILSALNAKREAARCAYIAPTFGQAKDVAWEYIKRLAAPVLQGEPHETELRVTLVNGAVIRLYGAENYDRMRGLYFDDAVLDEYADMDPRVWPEVVRPALSDRQGRALFIGTPKGRNLFWSVYDRAQGDPDWTALMLRASESGLLPSSELDAARRDMTPEQYGQEYECSFDAAIMGAYFARELAEAEANGRIAEVGFDALLPVHTAWDLGIGDSTAIWFFQVLAGEVRVIDHYENHGQTLAHYVAEIVARGYPQGVDYVPHDARVRSLETGRTRVETLVSLGRKPRLVTDHKLMDGINAARLTIPRMWFDAHRCAQGIEALRQYREDYDDKQRVFRGRPKHDWTSHTADAFRYLCVAWREMAPEPAKPPSRIVSVGPTNTATFDDLWATAPKRRR